MPSTAFIQEADIVIVPTIDPTDALNNGVNPIDIGIFTTTSPIIGNAGALYFGTNTSLSSLVGSNQGASALDITFVTVNNSVGQIGIQIDGNAFGLPSARLGTFNIFNLTDGVTAQIHNVLAGTVSLQLSNGGQSIQGTIQLGGSSGFSGGNVTSLYSATFTGTRVE
jgi:hypothetical protein